MFIYSFEKLEVWQLSRQMAVDVYHLLQKFPKSEHFGLCHQLRRAAISVPSNIAEGSGRISAKEQLHFIEIAYGSLMEVYCQLLLSLDLDYIDNEDFTKIKNAIDSIAKMLNKLRAYKLKSVNP